MTQTQPRTAKTLEQIGLENFAPYLMNRLMGRYNAGLRDDMKGLGLSTAKMRTLAVLAIIDSPTIGELAVFAVVETSTLSRALDGLENEGLVCRNVDDKDGRTMRVSITQNGRNAFKTIWPKMHANYEAMFEGIGDTERDAFINTLKKMLRNVRHHNF